MELDPICDSCLEGRPKHECSESKRVCGHHCNHVWSHDECCWCRATFGEEKEWGTRRLECTNSVE